MELTLAVRRQVTAAMVRKYAKRSKAEKAAILDHLVEVNEWHRDRARKALRVAMAGAPPTVRRARAPVLTYGPEVIDAFAQGVGGARQPDWETARPDHERVVTSLRR